MDHLDVDEAVAAIVAQVIMDMPEGKQICEPEHSDHGIYLAEIQHYAHKDVMNFFGRSFTITIAMVTIS